MKKSILSLVLLPLMFALQSCNDKAGVAREVADGLNERRSYIMAAGLFSDFNVAVDGKEIVVTIRFTDEVVRTIDPDEMTAKYLGDTLSKVMCESLAVQKDSQDYARLKELADAGYSFLFVFDCGGERQYKAEVSLASVVEWEPLAPKVSARKERSR